MTSSDSLNKRFCQIDYHHFFLINIEINFSLFTDDSLVKWCLTCKCVWRKVVSFKSCMQKKIAQIENYQCLQNIYREQTVNVSIVRWCVICFSSCDNVYDEPYLQMWYASSSWERYIISGVTIDIWKKNSVLYVETCSIQQIYWYLVSVVVSTIIIWRHKFQWHFYKYMFKICYIYSSQVLNL